MNQWVVTAEKQVDDICGGCFFYADSHAIEPVYDKRYSGVEEISSFEELSVSRNDFFYGILRIEDIKQFSPPWSLDLSFILFIGVIRNDDVEFLVIDQSLLHIDILEEFKVSFTLSFEHGILYRIYIVPDIRKVIGKIQECIADKDLHGKFQSVQEFLVLFEYDTLFIAIFEIKVEPVDPEDSSESSVFHDDDIVPDLRYRQHRLCIEEILVFRFLDFVFVSHTEEHPLS